MTNYILAGLAGIIQGLTEFLPISSSGHLIVFHDFFGFNFVDDLSFDVILHLATLAALVAFFRAEILNLIKAFGQSFVRWNLKNDAQQRLAWYLLIGTLPALLVGYFWGDDIENSFRNILVVAVMLIVFGLLLNLTEALGKKYKDISQLRLFDTLVIGLAQSLALVPGISRSGITIIAGLNQDLKRQEAAKFSFLLSIPVVLAAGAKGIFELGQVQLNQSELGILLVGFVFAAISGFFTIKYFLRFLQKYSLRPFVYYRIILGFAILLILYWFS